MEQIVPEQSTESSIIGTELEILYQDEDFVAINKPHGLLVHRSKIATNTDVFAIQELRNQLDRHVYPAHRLDRKTSGVLLFALNKEVLRLIRSSFDNQEIDKSYLSILRGFTPESGRIDYALKKDNGTLQDAITDYVTIKHSEINVPFGGHETSRYSLVKAMPKTGRMHQLRKHFAHIFHPIIGDRPYGCNKQNKLFLNKWNLTKMMLHASNLTFTHPIKKETISINATPSLEFKRVLKILQLDS